MRHVAGLYRLGVQRCTACGELLLDRRGTMHTGEGDPGGWRPGADVYHDGPRDGEQPYPGRWTTAVRGSRAATPCRTPPALPGLEDALQPARGSH